MVQHIVYVHLLPSLFALCLCGQQKCVCGVWKSGQNACAKWQIWNSVGSFWAVWKKSNFKINLFIGHTLKFEILWPNSKNLLLFLTYLLILWPILVFFLSNFCQTQKFLKKFFALGIACSTLCSSHSFGHWSIICMPNRWASFRRVPRPP